MGIAIDVNREWSHDSNDYGTVFLMHRATMEEMDAYMALRGISPINVSEVYSGEWQNKPGVYIAVIHGIGLRSSMKVTAEEVALPDLLKVVKEKLANLKDGHALIVVSVSDGIEHMEIHRVHQFFFSPQAVIATKELSDEELKLALELVAEERINA
jgi:hypothetical protein